MVSFTVYGDPVPQGSTRAFIPKGWNRAVITTDNKKLKPWRQQIAGVALAQMGESGTPLIARPAAVRVKAQFYFTHPKSLRRQVDHKTTKPDVDKLVRGLLDALTGICFEDDSQVCELRVTKAFGTRARTEVEITDFSLPLLEE